MYKLVAPPPRVAVLPSPLSSPLTSVLPPLHDAQTLKLLPLSDLHIPANPTAMKLILDNREYLERMDYLVLLGDLCACYGTDHEYRAVNNFITALHKPYTAINGNHEYVFEVHELESAQYSKIWREQAIQKKAEQLRKFLHFFEFGSLWRSYQNALGYFIFLGIDDVAGKKVESLSNLQRKFLHTELEAAHNEPTYIFCHAPLMLDRRLDMEYYDAERTACIEPTGAALRLLKNRAAPLFWISGHIHLRPDHHLYEAYELAPNMWQVHCPDSWGYSRWQRDHVIPQRHAELFSRHLEIEKNAVTLITHDQNSRQDILQQRIEW